MDIRRILEILLSRFEVINRYYWDKLMTLFWNQRMVIVGSCALWCAEYSVNQKEPDWFPGDLDFMTTCISKADLKTMFDYETNMVMIPNCKRYIRNQSYCLQGVVNCKIDLIPQLRSHGPEALEGICTPYGCIIRVVNTFDISISHIVIIYMRDIETVRIVSFDHVTRDYIRRKLYLGVPENEERYIKYTKRGYRRKETIDVFLKQENTLRWRCVMNIVMSMKREEIIDLANRCLLPQDIVDILDDGYVLKKTTEDDEIHTIGYRHGPIDI